MNKMTLYQKPPTQAAYRINPVSRVAVCSPYARSFGFVRDNESSWEDFSKASLSTYLTKGFHLLKANLRKLENLSEPYSVADSQKLVFMTDSLLQARNLLDEISAEEIAT